MCIEIDNDIDWDDSEWDDEMDCILDEDDDIFPTYDDLLTIYINNLKKH